MSRLVESIKIEGGVILNLEYHQERMDRSVMELTGRRNSISLYDSISVPDECSSGIWKCRFVYSGAVELIDFIPYRKRSIQSLKIVYADIDYSCKYEDRSGLDKLMQQRGGCDDILIVKDGLVTDTSFSNIAFSDGAEWITPAEPLLRGTKRSMLLKNGLLSEKDITPPDIMKFRHAAVINAMLDPGDMIIPVESIF